MITAVCFLILVASVPLLGGSLTKMGTVRLNAWWTIVASLVIQVFLIEILAGSLDGTIAAAFHLGSYGLAIMFVWYNRHVTGMPLMVFGGLLNAAAIAANGGVMPARLEALQTAGIVTDSPEFENSAPVVDAKLAFLGDVFAIPEGIPFANVFSVGDIILVLGGGIAVHTICESRLWQLRHRLSDARMEVTELQPDMLELTSSLSGQPSPTNAIGATDSDELDSHELGSDKLDSDELDGGHDAAPAHMRTPAIERVPAGLTPMPATLAEALPEFPSDEELMGPNGIFAVDRLPTYGTTPSR